MAPAAAPVSREELVTQLLDRPDEVIPQAVLQSPQFAQTVRELTQSLLMEQAQQWQAQQTQEQAVVAPEVAKEVFLRSHGISQDFDTWLTTPEGQAVNDLVERDPARGRLLQAYKDDGDVKGMASVLTKTLEAHRLGKKAASARTVQNGEKARVDASRPPSAPIRPPAPPLAAAPAVKGLYETWDDNDLKNFLAGAQPYSRED